VYQHQAALAQFAQDRDALERKIDFLQQELRTAQAEAELQDVDRTFHSAVQLNAATAAGTGAAGDPNASFFSASGAGPHAVPPVGFGVAHAEERKVNEVFNRELHVLRRVEADLDAQQQAQGSSGLNVSYSAANRSQRLPRKYTADESVIAEDTKREVEVSQRDQRSVVCDHLGVEVGIG